jgi:WD40 repeat protein
MTPDPNDLTRTELNSVLAAYLRALEAGTPPDRDQLLAQYPDLTADLRAFFANRDRMEQLARPLREQAPIDTVRYFGDYELLEEIARGGMGVVYRARQVSLDRTVALKMILAGRLASPGDVQRFKAEAQAAGNLDHPNIVPIYEVGEHQGQQYFSMKLIEDGSLATLRRSVPDSRARLRSVAKLMATVARAVHHAHQRGILHRDLKPANILIDQQGEPHVTDFGLAKRVEGDSGLTGSGAIVGTPSYMAPEQARASKGMTTAADIWSLGAILYEMLTGRLPFRGETPLETLQQVLQSEPERPSRLNPQVDRDLETICLKCLEKEPSRRYGSALALAEDLERWLRGMPIEARPVGSIERTLRWCQRNPVIAALVAACALSLVAGSGISTWFAAEAAHRAADANLAKDRAERNEKDAATSARLADEKTAETRLNLYDADMQLAQAAWEGGNLRRVFALLDQYRPQPGEEDLRDFEWYCLQRLCHGDRRTLKNGSPATSAVALACSPDSKELATVGRDAKLRRWELATGKELPGLAAPEGVVVSLAYGPTTKELIAVTTHKPRPGMGRDVRREQAVRKGEVEPSLDRFLGAFTTHPLPLGGGPAAAEKLAPARLAGPVHVLLPGPDSVVWMAMQLIPFKERQLYPRCMFLAPDRKTLAVGGLALSWDGKDRAGVVLLWDLEAGKEKAMLRGHRHIVSTVAIAPDGKLMASAGLDGAVLLWDLGSGQVRATLPSHGWQAVALAFSPDSKLLAAGYEDGAVKLWDASSQERGTLRGHLDTVNALAFTPDNKTLISCSEDGTVKLWDFAAACGALAPEGGTVVHRHNQYVVGLGFAPDSRTLSVLEMDGGLYRWDTARGQDQSDERWGPVREAPDADPEPRLRVGAAGAWCAAFTADAKFVAVGEMDGPVAVCDTLTGRPKFRKPAHAGPVAAVAFSPDDELLVSAGATSEGKGDVKLWDMKGNARSLSGHAKEVSTAAFAPDGKTLATGSWDRTVKLWDVASGEELATLTGHGDRVHSVAFTRDGKRLATASRDVIKIWDVAQRREVQTIRGFTYEVGSMAFSRDGRRLATACGEGVTDSRSFPQGGRQVPPAPPADEEPGKRGAVKLWDTQTGREVLTLGAPSEHASLVAFSPDGKRLATVSTEQPFNWLIPTPSTRVRIWDATPLEEKE